MKLIREMHAIKDRVMQLLEQHPHLRNSDNKLIATIWKQDILNLGFTSKGITANDFLKMYATDQVSNAETIRRVRQKIQEENPQLRGTVNDLRQEQAEEVRKEIVK